MLVLLVIIFLSWIGFQVFCQVSSQERMVRTEAQRMKAVYLADSGLQWARFSLARDPAWRGGLKLLKNGKIEVEVEKEGQEYKVLSKSESAGTFQARYGIFFQDDKGIFVLKSYGELFH